MIPSSTPLAGRVALPDGPPPAAWVAKAQQIFDSALGLPQGQRDAFVAGACAGDDAMMTEVRALLAADEGAGAFMQDDLSPAPELARLRSEKEGERIGRYRLLQEIGEGGFGTVWMAEQTEPMSRQVALKIIKPGMDTREVIARFEREQQALALMEHPNIAKVFDAGVTPLGRPYFVMELVRGVSITQYCDEAGLDTRARLALFDDVCSAINHAHQKGVIHRDIKPSNVLVTRPGDSPVAKVIDFGIAKATPGKLNDGTLFTRVEQFIGTPVYMSPEQASGGGTNVDTRSDIYALGILLYELLTGTPPFDARTMASAGYDEMRRIIREVEPPRPSARLRTTTGGNRLLLAGARRIEPGKVSRLVEADLDWIVMKAIDKDPGRRYQTASGLAHDVQRFLNDEPVSARPPDAVYQFRKFARRHKVALRTAAGIAAVLVAATTVSTRQAFRAGRAERQAKQSEATAQREATRADGEAESAQQNLYYAQMHLGQQAWREHRGLRHLHGLLAGWLPVDNSPDRRGWEWYYLNSVPYQNVRTLMQGGNSLRPTAVAWHAGNKRLAEGAADGTIRIWDVDRGQATQVLSGLPPGDYNFWWGAKWLAWNPDGSELAAGGSDGTVHVWEAGTGKETRVFRTREAPVRAVAFSADGTRLAAWGAGGTVTIWESGTGRLTAEVVHPGTVSAGAWSPDDQILASGHDDGTVTFSGTRTGDPITSLQAHTDMICDLAWSPDGTRIASTGASDFWVSIWDAASRQKVLGPLRHSHNILAIAWEPDGKRIASGGFDETVKVWDAVSGQETVTLRGHVDGVTSLAWGPAGHLASGGYDGSLKVWDSFADQESRLLAGHGRRATSTAWSPDGKRLAWAGDDGIVRIADAAARREILSVPAHDSSKIVAQFGLVRSLAWRPDGKRLASAGLDGAVRVWDAETGQEVFALPAGHGVVWCVAWSPDGNSLAAGSQDGTIRIAEHLEDTPTVRSFLGHRSLARDPETHDGTRALAWSPQGDRLASGGWDRLVKVWDPARGVETVRMTGHAHCVMGVAWSPDGRQLASASGDHLIMTWDARNGRKLQTMAGHNDFVDAVRWSPDGKRLASAGLDNSVRLWDPRTGQETFVLRGNLAMFHDVSWSPDARQLAAASSDGQVWIWDATQGFEQKLFPSASK